MIFLLAYVIIAMALAICSAVLWDSRENTDEVLAFAVPILWPLFLLSIAVAAPIMLLARAFLRLGQAINTARGRLARNAARSRRLEEEEV